MSDEHFLWSSLFLNFCFKIFQGELIWNCKLTLQAKAAINGSAKHAIHFLRFTWQKADERTEQKSTSVESSDDYICT